MSVALANTGSDDDAFTVSGVVALDNVSAETQNSGGPVDPV